MGLLNIFSKPEETAHLTRLPSGSFTMDGSGTVIASTLPRSFPEAHVLEIGQLILTIFRSARTADLLLTEITVNFASLKVTARELRGGAIIFLAPESAK
jgi:hypothetical protein